MNRNRRVRALKNQSLASHHGKLIILETVGKLYKNRISDAAGKRTWYTKRLGFVIPDNEIRAKLRSAFDHLIYLTRRYEGEKRE